MSTEPASRKAKVGCVSAVYGAVVTGLVLLWSIERIFDQVRAQPQSGRCGGIMAPPGDALQGEATDCDLIIWRAAVLVLTGFALFLPAFLPAFVLVVRPRHAHPQGIGTIRLLLFVFLALASVYGTFVTFAAMDHNPQGEFCAYHQTGFAPWSNGGEPCWPEWQAIGVHWGLAFAVVGVLCAPVIALAAAAEWRSRRQKGG